MCGEVLMKLKSKSQKVELLGMQKWWLGILEECFVSMSNNVPLECWRIVSCGLLGKGIKRETLLSSCPWVRGRGRGIEYCRAKDTVF